MAKSIKTKQKTLTSSAFKVLLEGLGPRRTTQFWNAFVAPKEDYVKERRKIFGRKSASAMAQEAKKYNRRKK